MNLRLNQSFKGSLTILLILLFIVVISVWSVFYIFVYKYVYNNAKEQAILAANQIVNDLSRDLVELERICYTMSVQGTLHDFIVADELNQKLQLADKINVTLNDIGFNTDFADNIIVIDKYNDFYRFAGRLSNSSCSMLARVISNMDLPEHIVLEMDGLKYIGYATAIDAENDQGVIAILAEENKFMDMAFSYMYESHLAVGIVAEGQLVSGNTEAYEILQEQLISDPSVVKKHVGITPFEVVAVVDKNHLLASTFYFTSAALCTIIAFFLVLFIFVKVLNKKFFNPMLQIMHNVENLDAYSSNNMLPQTYSAEFDQLIEKINNMLVRLDKQSNEAKEAALLLKNAEIAKQKAIIFSLKKQINAHFTINTLSTIKALVEQNDYTQAGQVLKDLSAIIRYAYNKDEFISVWDEMATLEKYVGIMNARYNNKIQLVLDIDDRLMDVLMPRMLLQPIVENSIVHGFKDMDYHCIIQVQAGIDNKKLCIMIKDNGLGMDLTQLDSLSQRFAEHQHEDNEGVENIALVNIKNRINSYYNEQGEFIIISTPREATIVKIILPIE